jgi:transposase
VPHLGGSKRTQVDEPKDHALGRSRGGFGTKVHLVCDSSGAILAIWLTAGQRHDSQGFAPVMGRARRPRQMGRSRWPQRLAGDKGYTYPAVRGWLRRHRIGAVIPTRSDQPSDPNFDRRTYRRRNIIERVVGWFKECRALGTRYDKLAVNYIALWVIANIHRLLRKRLRFLKIEFSETT